MRSLFYSVLGLLALALLFPALAFGNPFLVCDPQAGAEQYVLEINGTDGAIFTAQPDGSMKYDLAGLADGTYTVRAKAGNIWGWSEYSLPFEFTKAVPGAPSGLRVSSGP